MFAGTWRPVRRKYMYFPAIFMTPRRPAPFAMQDDDLRCLGPELSGRSSPAMMTSPMQPKAKRQLGLARVIGAWVPHRHKIGRMRWHPADDRQSNCYQVRLSSMPLQAFTRPLTALTELSNMACSSLVIRMSITFSMPPAPITVGTPTYMPLRPRAPST